MSIFSSFFLIVAGILVTIAINSSEQARNAGIDLAVSKSQGVASKVTIYLEEAVQGVTILTNSLKAIKSGNNPSRNDVNRIITENLKSNTNYVAMWQMWESEKFDGKDRLYKNDPMYSYCGGMFNTSFYRNGTEIISEPGTLPQYNEDYYTLPKKLRKIVVLEPYMYTYTGDTADNVYETTIAMPIMIQDQYLGTAGIDISLGSLNKIIANQTIYNTGFSAIISNKLQIAAHPDNTLRGKELSKIVSEDLENVKNAVDSGKIYYHIGTSINTGKKVLRCFAPVKIGESITPWSVMVEIPMNEISAQARKLIVYIAFFGLLGLILMSFVTLWISSNVNKIFKTILDEIDKLTKNITAGKLSARTDVEKINFEFRSVPAGFNDTLDAITEPLNVSAEYIKRIAYGDIPEPIVDHYNGDFDDIKNNLNLLIEAEKQIIEKSRLIANGDLTVELQKRSENDNLLQSLSDMVKSIARIIGDFQNAAVNISGSSQQMSATAQEMSQGATEQASSAEEVSSSMEQMAANIQQNTENAQQTQKIALNAADGIAKVAEAAKATQKNIEEINDKVSIIGEIARQTNILALNAAVEAARAGEHGKGFAVVAAEVRKLAERSHVSAVEINTLTKTSLKATEDAGKLMEAIVPEIIKTARLIQEIAAASLEQNTGAEQVNNAIQQLNQVTQQNAAASEEVATSSEEFSGQAEQLLENVRFFKLENGTSSKKPMTSKLNETQPIIVAHPSAGNKKMQKTSKLKKAGFILNMDKRDAIDSEYENF